MRLRRAIFHDTLINPQRFDTEVLGRLAPECQFHEEGFGSRPVGFSDTANTDSPEAEVFRLSSDRGALVSWTMRALEAERTTAVTIVQQVAERLASEDATYLVQHRMRRVGDLYMVNAERLQFETRQRTRYRVGAKSGTVQDWEVLFIISEKKENITAMHYSWEIRYTTCN